MAPRLARSGGSATPEAQQPINVLDHAEALPPVPRPNLTEVARRLTRSGCLLAVRYDDRSRRLVFFSVPERLKPTKVVRSPVVERLRPRRIVRASVRLPNGDRWVGSLDGLGERDQPALLTIERKSRRRAVQPADAALVIPRSEADVLLELLNGLVALARKEGILPSALIP